MSKFKQTVGTISMVVAGISLIVGLLVGAPWAGLQLKRFLGTEAQSVETDIYRENKSYVEGTVRDLREMQVEYYGAEGDHKSAIASLILQRANELDWDRLPSDVSQFLRELKSIQNEPQGTLK